MGMRGTYHKARVQELVDNFKIWRDERLPGTRSFLSKYDRVGVIMCKWLFQAVHDIQASSTFDYILLLMVSLLLRTYKAIVSFTSFCSLNYSALVNVSVTAVILAHFLTAYV